MERFAKEDVRDFSFTEIQPHQADLALNPEMMRQVGTFKPYDSGSKEDRVWLTHYDDPANWACMAESADKDTTVAPVPEKKLIAGNMTSLPRLRDAYKHWVVGCEAPYAKRDVNAKVKALLRDGYDDHNKKENDEAETMLANIKAAGCLPANY
jgi:hypothetical protein